MLERNETYHKNSPYIGILNIYFKNFITNIHNTLFFPLFNFCKKKRTFIILQNREQAYVFQQNTPFHSATKRKQYLRRKTSGVRASNKISHMKSNDNNLDLQQTKGKFYTETKFYNSFRSL